MCHLVRVEKDIKSSFFTEYDNYHYCCYPDVFSRILSEQIKAQLARDWAHCTDITFKDLEQVSFQGCSEAQKADPSAVDGKTIPYGATYTQRKKAYQYKYKCLDYSDLNAYIKDSVGGIDNFRFEEQIRGLKEQTFVE